MARLQEELGLYSLDSSRSVSVHRRPSLDPDSLEASRGSKDHQSSERLFQTMMGEGLDERTRTFQPRALRLSSSSPAFGTRNQSEAHISVQRWKEGFMNGSLMPLFQTWAERQEVDHFSNPPSRDRPSDLLQPSRTPSHRLRTRSVDRSNGEALLRAQNLACRSSSSHRAGTSNPLEASCSAPTSRRFSVSSTYKSPSGLASRLPIERTALSILPHKRQLSSDSSVDDDRSVRIINHVDSQRRAICSSPSRTSSRSTPDTSVESATSPFNRPRYQPRPLLLSSFRAQGRTCTSSSSKALDQSETSTDGDVQSMLPRVPHSESAMRNRSLADVKLEQETQIRQQKLHATEAKQLRKRAKEAELRAISSRINNGRRTSTIEEADEDDCWSWLSGSDAEEESEDDEEEMAVVWRASLDVGRRVPQDRKALGKGHGIRMPRKKVATATTRPTSSSSVSTDSRCLQSSTSWIQSSLRSILSYGRLTNIIRLAKHAMFSLHPRSTSSTLVLFGSGLLTGVTGRLLWSALTGQVCWGDEQSTWCEFLLTHFGRQFPYLLHCQFIPSSATGLGLFIHLGFPQRSFGADLSTPSMGAGRWLQQGFLNGGVGVYSQWCKHS